ncbi:MAG TPA: BlaI/MecI/CopY family transcriptional regulator [Epulopiscium sp.]|nr:BlaI/MecI/CopY family transcriptional regulator [Candidatus Epulonipiscium sp.]
MLSLLGLFCVSKTKEVAWNRNTTYTVIKKCIDKGAIERYEPRFMCKAMISHEQVQQYETEELISKMFGGSTERFFASFVNSPRLTQEEIDTLKGIVDQLK